MRQMIEIIYYVGMAAAAAGLVYELRRDLMMLQQNSYFNNRYRNWLRESGDTTSAWRIVGLAVLLFSLSRFAGGVAGMVLMGTFGMATAIRSRTA